MHLEITIYDASFLVDIVTTDKFHIKPLEYERIISIIALKEGVFGTHGT